jgi:hypothetical protein
MTRAAIIREHRLDERMVGDPRVAAGDLMALHACLYAAAILRKRGALPPDAGGFEARWAPREKQRLELRFREDIERPAISPKSEVVRPLQRGRAEDIAGKTRCRSETKTAILAPEIRSPLCLRH